MAISIGNTVQMLEVLKFARDLEQQEHLHAWRPGPLIKAFACMVHPRWFNMVNLQDLFREVGLDKNIWGAAFKPLVDDGTLISDSAPEPHYNSLDGTRYQVIYCYRVQRAAYAEYQKQIAALQPDPPPNQPTTTEVLSPSLVENTRGYIEGVVTQANGCYENRWFDACSVMVRKLVEMLIIAVYEHEKRAAHIQGTDQNYFMLGAMIERFLADSALNLGRETKAGLPLIKELGDRSAHNRHFLAKKTDVDKIIPYLRVIVPELLHLAGLKA